MQENLISGAPFIFVVPRPAAALLAENLISGAPLFVVGPENEDDCEYDEEGTEALGYG